MTDTTETAPARGKKRAVRAQSQEATAIPADGASDRETTEAERAQLAAEEKRLERAGVYNDDPALQQLAPGRSPHVVVEHYDDADERDTSLSIAASLQNERAGTQPSAAREWSPPPPFDTVRPAAPLVSEQVDQIVGITVDVANRAHVNAGESVRERDELDTLVGSGRRTSDVVFDWARDRKFNHRLVFTRHYYDRGVLVDRFRVADQNAQREVADKARAIRAYNVTCTDERQKLGYLALVVGTSPTFEEVERALRREIVTTFVEGEPYNGPDTAARPEAEMGDFAVAAVRAAKIGIKTIEGEPVTYYHDAMQGVYTASFLGRTLEARSISDVVLDRGGKRAGLDSLVTAEIVAIHTAERAASSALSDAETAAAGAAAS